jgi:hypothetical protein
MSAPRANESENLDGEFRQLAESVAAYYQRFGASVKPYHEASLPHFSRLPLEKKRNAVHYMRKIWGVTEHHVSNQVDAGNNAVSLWSAMKSCGLTPGSDLFGYLEPDDKIEIYSLDGIQFWRNLSLFSVCSYTLEEIHSFEWHERYDRKDADNTLIMKAIGELVSSNSMSPVAAKIPSHLVIEKFSEERFVLDVRHDYFFPLTFEGKDVAAFLVTSKVGIISRNPNASVAAKQREFQLLKTPNFSGDSSEN